VATFGDVADRTNTIRDCKIRKNESEKARLVIGEGNFGEIRKNAETLL
jgi:hypothetical protein